MKVNAGEKLGFELFHVCEAMKKLDVDELEVVREIDENGKHDFEFNFEPSLRSHRLPCSWGWSAKKYPLSSTCIIDEQWPLYSTTTLEDALVRLADAVLNDEVKQDGELVGTLSVHSCGMLKIIETEYCTHARTQTRLITSQQIEQESGLENAVSKVFDLYGEMGEDGNLLNEFDITIRYSPRSYFISEKDYRSVETDGLAEYLLDSIRATHEDEQDNEVSFNGVIKIHFDPEDGASIKIEHTIDEPVEETVHDRLTPLEALNEGEEKGDLIKRHAPGEIAFCGSVRIVAEPDQIIIKNMGEEIARIEHETHGVLRFAIDLDGKSENAVIVPSSDETLRIRFLEEGINIETIDDLKVTLSYTEIGIDAQYRPAILSLQLSTFIRHKGYEAIESLLRQHLQAAPVLLDVLKLKADELQDSRLTSLHEAYRMSQAMKNDSEKPAIKPQVRRPQI